MKNTFIKLAIKHNALRFGDFTLKSGRVSPYFFNAGLFYSGESLQILGRLYAEAILASNIKFEHLFGPAYKGLPLATATAFALAEKGIDISVTFNRKEAKDHGEGGVLIGSPLSSGNTIIIDDVITAGTAFREAQMLINSNGGNLTGVIIALNRCEKGQNDSSAIADIEKQGIKVISIISLFDIIDYLKAEKAHELVEKILKYHAQYGIKEQ